MGKKQQQKYVVKKILDRKDETSSKGVKKTYYKVLWEGYDESEATWEITRNLYGDQQVKKEIKKFNHEYTKNKKSRSLQTKESSKVNKENPPKQIQTQTSTKNHITKKTVLLKDAIKSIKENESRKITSEKNYKKAKNSQLSENVNTQSANVVKKIFDKIRQNVANENKQGNVSLKEKQEKLVSKMKEKIKAFKKDKKAAAKASEDKSSKNYLRKSETSKPLQEKFDEEKLKKSLADNFKLPIVTQTLGKDHSLSYSGTSQVLDHIIEQKHSSIKCPLDKTVDQKGSSNDYIKLELADELCQQQPTALNFKKSSTNDQISSDQQEEQFQIKGMLMCKNEYFYLVEVNGKSQMLSRAEILNAHPYELICFYERKLHFRPTGNDMMVL